MTIDAKGVTEMSLPKWPEKRDFAPIQFGDGSYMWGNGSCATDYERARAEAAIARLKVAVDAMKEIRAVHPLMHNGGNWDKFVDGILEQIGEPESGG
jgi:hypothetical protein